MKLYWKKILYIFYLFLSIQFPLFAMDSSDQYNRDHSNRGRTGRGGKQFIPSQSNEKYYRGRNITSPQVDNKGSNRGRGREKGNSLSHPIIQEETSQNSLIKWVPNLNFTYFQRAVNADGELSSYKNIQWHFDQTSTLFRAYNNCQGREDGGNAKGRRNVLTALFGIVYTDTQGECWIKNFQINRVFLDGWTVNDTVLPALKLKENQEIKDNFVSLSNYCTFEECKKMGIVGNEYSSVTHDFKRTQCHSEKTLLIHVLKNIDSFILLFPATMRQVTSLWLLKREFPKNSDIVQKCISYQYQHDKLSLQKEIAIHDFILNIATLRDMCSECGKMFQKEMCEHFILLKPLVGRLREVGYSVMDSANIVVLTSGISDYGEKGSKDNTRYGYVMPNQSSRAINILLPSTEKIVYHTDSPYHVEMFPKLVLGWNIEQK